jgi:uncharacterized MAPEG superfamily protein
MTPELHVLALAVLLQAIQYSVMSVACNWELGVRKTASARDYSRLGGPIEAQLSDKAGRLVRALNNHFEGLILFSAAVVIVVLSDRTTGFSAACAWTYLGARILYVPAYYFGLSPWRSLIWFVGFLATLAMILSTWI